MILIWKIRYRLMRIVRWAEGFAPIQCWYCRRWVVRKSLRTVEHRLGGHVLVCDDCIDSLYSRRE